MHVPLGSILKHTFGLIPKTLGAITIAVNTICSVGIIAAITDKATDGQSTRAVLDLGEKAIGRDGMLKVGRGVFNGTRYLGEGLVGVGKEMNQRYDTAGGPGTLMTPPVTRGGFMVESALVAEASALSDRALSVQSPRPAGEFLSCSAGEAPAKPQAVEQRPTVAALPTKKL